MPLSGAAPTKLFSIDPLPPSVPSVTFSQLSSKFHLVCYKSSNSSVCLQVVAFCAEICRPPLPTHPHPQPPLRISLWVLPNLGPPSQTSCIHPLIHPLDIHPSVDHQWHYKTGIINLDYLNKRWLWGGPSWSVQNALDGDANEAQTLGLWLHCRSLGPTRCLLWGLTALAASCFSVTHTPHVRYRCSSLSKKKTIAAFCLASSWTNIQGCIVRSPPVQFSRHSSSSQLCG